MSCVGSPVIDYKTDHPLQVAMREIMEVLPQERIKEIAEEHLEFDEGFRAAVSHLKSKHWMNLIDTIKETPEWKEFRDYVKDFSGIDLEVFSKCSTAFIGNLTVPSDPDSKAKMSLKSFLQDLEKILPREEIMKIIYKRIIDTGIFKQTYERIRSEKFREIIKNLIAVPEVKEVLDDLETMGINIRGTFAIYFTP